MKKLKPSKIIAVGLNYRDHAEELGMKITAEPIIFLKAPGSLIYNGDAIVYPPQTRDLHYEGELAVIIKNRIKNIGMDKVAENILGFSCGNDITARDLQKIDGQWARAKSFDTFCAVGPEIVQLKNANNLAIKTYLNGEIKQSSNTSNMIFNVEYLVSFISQMMTLEPEDIILTGTPPGVGPMQVGDTIEIEIEGIGILKNKVVKT